MKIELNSAEATALFSGVANTSRVTELEALTVSLREERDSVIRDRSDSWKRQDELSEKLSAEMDKARQAEYEIATLKREVARLLDLTKPFPKERKLSLVFHKRRTGETIQAIKELREALNLGLKDAKEVVEGIYTNGSNAQLFALSNAFKGMNNGDAIGDLRTELVKSGAVDSLVGKRADDGETLANELNAILYGEFHNYW